MGGAPAWDRAEVCHKIGDLIEERRDDFVRELSLEQGKPFTAEAIPDIDETAENFRLAAEDVKRMETAIIPSQDVNKRILTQSSVASSAPARSAAPRSACSWTSACTTTSSPRWSSRPRAGTWRPV